MKVDLNKPLRRKDTHNPVKMLSKEGERPCWAEFGISGNRFSEDAPYWFINGCGTHLLEDYLENAPETMKCDVLLTFDSKGNICSAESLSKYGTRINYIQSLTKLNCTTVKRLKFEVEVGARE